MVRCIKIRVLRKLARRNKSRNQLEVIKEETEGTGSEPVAKRQKLEDTNDQSEEILAILSEEPTSPTEEINYQGIQEIFDRYQPESSE